MSGKADFMSWHFFKTPFNETRSKQEVGVCLGGRGGILLCFGRGKLHLRISNQISKSQEKWEFEQRKAADQQKLQLQKQLADQEAKIASLQKMVEERPAQVVQPAATPAPVPAAKAVAKPEPTVVAEPPVESSRAARLNKDKEALNVPTSVQPAALPPPANKPVAAVETPVTNVGQSLESLKSSVDTQSSIGGISSSEDNLSSMQLARCAAAYFWHTVTL